MLKRWWATGSEAWTKPKYHYLILKYAAEETVVYFSSIRMGKLSRLETSEST